MYFSDPKKKEILDQKSNEIVLVVPGPTAEQTFKHEDEKGIL